MTNLARAQTPATSDLAMQAWVEMLRAAIKTIPQDQRHEAFTQVRDLFERDATPRRGSDLLRNIYLVYKRDPQTARGALDVVAELGLKKDQAQPVRYAINYLKSRRILRRIGYGKYQLEDGSIVDGIP